jgi:hypothetical protein
MAAALVTQIRCFTALGFDGTHPDVFNSGFIGVLCDSCVSCAVHPSFDDAQQHVLRRVQWRLHSRARLATVPVTQLFDGAPLGSDCACFGVCKGGRIGALRNSCARHLDGLLHSAATALLCHMMALAAAASCDALLHVALQLQCRRVLISRHQPQPRSATQQLRRNSCDATAATQQLRRNSCDATAATQ